MILTIFDNVHFAIDSGCHEKTIFFKYCACERNCALAKSHRQTTVMSLNASKAS